MSAPTPDLRLYDRRAAVFVGRSDSAGATGRAVGYRYNGPSVDGDQIVPGFRIAFEVEQSIKAKTNKAQATIFGLSENSRATFADFKRPRFQIEAGYAGSSALIFDGEAVHVVSSADAGGGFKTVVSAHDGLQAKRGIVDASLAPNATVGQAIEKIASSMGVNASRALVKAKRGDFDGAIKTFFGGLVLSGPADKAMNELAQGAGFEWAIVNGELVILKSDQTFDEETIILGPSSGLIGSPERRYDEKKPGANLITIKSLLNPRLVVGRRVRVSSKEISGDFRVDSVKHAGDTHGAEYTSTIEATGL